MSETLCNGVLCVVCCRSPAWQSPPCDVVSVAVGWRVLTAFTVPVALSVYSAVFVLLDSLAVSRRFKGGLMLLYLGHITRSWVFTAAFEAPYSATIPLNGLTFRVSALMTSCLFNLTIYAVKYTFCFFRFPNTSVVLCAGVSMTIPKEYT